MNTTMGRSQAHATFVIGREYDAPVAKVWQALSDNDARDQWFKRRTTSSPPPRSPTTSGSVDSAPRRIVFTYDMWADDQHLSTSLTTIAMQPLGGAHPPHLHRTGRPLRRSRQPHGREEGTKGLLDQLGAFLEGA
jgi:uncharacterized protein YndB with AHSA1/START domain